MSTKNILLIICVLLLSYHHAFTQMPTDSLVAYYPFNGNANDTSGNGFNGSLNGQISVAGQCATAYKFLSNYIACGDPVGNEFDLVDDASISLWMKLFDVPFNGYFTLIGKDVGPGNYNKWFLAATKNQLVFHINVEQLQNNGAWVSQSTISYALNTFYHIVVTKTGFTYKFYINGTYYGSQNLQIYIPDVPSPLRIGDLHDGSQTLNAAIDEVLIYRKVLTQAEINQIYTYCPPVIITSSGSIAQDQSADLKIYPNPSSGKFVLSFANQMIEVRNVSVFNVLGEKIFEQKFQLYNRDVIIDLGDQPKGVYLLQVQTRKKIMIRKIVVE